MAALSFPCSVQTSSGATSPRGDRAILGRLYMDCLPRIRTVTNPLTKVACESLLMNQCSKKLVSTLVRRVCLLDEKCWEKIRS
jgi:hypothetical protein